MNTFDEIIGNEQVVAVMRRWAESGKPNHAYIISGQGAETVKLTNAFTKTLMCQNKGDINCRCLPCRTFETNNHPDVMYVRPVKAKSLGVDDIREQVVAPAEIKPYSSNHKVFIIENAELMTVAAQNALLKTLEDPPPYGVFLLLTNNSDAMLSTILSRCVVLKMNAMPIEKKVQEEEFVALRSEIVVLIEQIEAAAGQNDIVSLFAAASKVAEYKDNINDVLDMLYLFYRDAAVHNETGNTALLIQKDIVEVIKRYEHDVNACLARTKAIYNAKQRLKRNANFQLTIEVMLLDFMN